MLLLEKIFVRYSYLKIITLKNILFLKIYLNQITYKNISTIILLLKLKLISLLCNFV